jgi:hypothetical protein
MSIIGYGLVIEGTFFSTERYWTSYSQHDIIDLFTNKPVLENITQVAEFRNSQLGAIFHRDLYINRLNEDHKQYMLELMDYCHLPALITVLRS